MNKQATKLNPIKTWLSLVVRISLFAVALMWPAGTWRWWEAWVVVGLALYIIPGFDVLRYQWSEPFPLWLETLALVLHVPCFLPYP